MSDLYYQPSPQFMATLNNPTIPYSVRRLLMDYAKCRQLLETALVALLDHTYDFYNGKALPKGESDEAIEHLLRAVMKT